jgi:RHS repeat-associated protein
MYAPQLGTFTSQDPLAADPTLLYDNNWIGDRLRVMRNLYGYTSNNPVNFTDPSGLDAFLPLACKQKKDLCYTAAGEGFDECLKHEPRVDCQRVYVKRIQDCEAGYQKCLKDQETPSAWKWFIRCLSHSIIM